MTGIAWVVVINAELIASAAPKAIAKLTVFISEVPFDRIGAGVLSWRGLNSRTGYEFPFLQLPFPNPCRHRRIVSAARGPLDLHIC